MHYYWVSNQYSCRTVLLLVGWALYTIFLWNYVNEIDFCHHILSKKMKYRLSENSARVLPDSKSNSKNFKTCFQTKKPWHYSIDISNSAESLYDSLTSCTGWSRCTVSRKVKLLNSTRVGLSPQIQNHFEKVYSCVCQSHRRDELLRPQPTRRTSWKLETRLPTRVGN